MVKEWIPSRLTFRPSTRLKPRTTFALAGGPQPCKARMNLATTFRNPKYQNPNDNLPISSSIRDKVGASHYIGACRGAATPQGEDEPRHYVSNVYDARL